ncbi:MAG: hypothetical protein LAT81_07935, partial [Oceanicaulis sp.]|nr:hypothetical protein [Oceanicaulis sp.]
SASNGFSGDFAENEWDKVIHDDGSIAFTSSQVVIQGSDHDSEASSSGSHAVADRNYDEISIEAPFTGTVTFQWEVTLASGEDVTQPTWGFFYRSQESGTVVSQSGTDTNPLSGTLTVEMTEGQSLDIGIYHTGIVDGNGVELKLTNFSATEWVRREIDLAALDVIEGGSYRISVGNDTVERVATASDSLNSIASRLASDIAGLSSELRAHASGSKVIITRGADNLTVSVEADAVQRVENSGYLNSGTTPTSNQRVISLNDVADVDLDETTYFLKLGNATVEYDRKASDGMADVLAGLAAAVSAESGLTGADRVTQVSNNGNAETQWTALLNGLATVINADQNRVTAAADGSGRMLTLTANTVNESFSLDDVHVSLHSHVANNGLNPSRAASGSQGQQHEVQFDLSAFDISAPLDAVLTLVINGQTYSVSATDLVATASQPVLGLAPFELSAPGINGQLTVNEADDQTTLDLGDLVAIEGQTYQLTVFYQDGSGAVETAAVSFTATAGMQAGGIVGGLRSALFDLYDQDFPHTVTGSGTSIVIGSGDLSADSFLLERFVAHAPGITEAATSITVDLDGVTLVSGQTYRLVVTLIDGTGQSTPFDAQLLVDDQTTTASLAAALGEQLSSVAGFSPSVSVDGSKLVLGSGALASSQIELQSFVSAGVGSTIQFPAGSPAAGQVIQVDLAGQTFRVQVGSSLYGTDVSGNWGAVLAELKQQIEAAFGESSERDWHLLVETDSTSRTLSLRASAMTDAMFQAFGLFDVDEADGEDGVLPLISAANVSILAQQPATAGSLGALVDSLSSEISGYTVGLDTDSGVMTITGPNGQAFSLDAVYLTPGPAVWAAGTIFEAGESRAQENELRFTADAIADGSLFTIVIDGTVYEVEVGESYHGVAVEQGNAASIYNAFKALIEDNQPDGDVTLTVSVVGSGDSRHLRLVANQLDEAFEISSASVSEWVSEMLANPAAVTELVAPGEDANQQSSVTFGGDEPATVVIYRVTIGTQTYSISPEANESWQSMLSRLATTIEAGGLMTASASGATLTLTAVQANQVYNVRAQAEDTSITSGEGTLRTDGDYVVITPDREPGNFRVVAGGNLSVVSLPVYAGTDDRPGDNIRLGAGGVLEYGDVVVVSELDVGDDGSVTLTAPKGGIAVGGTITAQSLSVTSRDDLTLTTAVTNLDISMTGGGSVTVTQSGDLVINQLAMNGGDVTLVVDGDVTINDFTNLTAGGTLTIQATGSILFADQEQAIAVLDTAVLQAGGAITGAIHVSQLDLRAGVDSEQAGNVDLFNGGALEVIRLDSGGAAIKLQAQGNLDLKAALGLAGTATLELESIDGSLILHEGIESGTGLVQLSAGSDLVMLEAVEIVSGAGLVSLDAGAAIQMDASAFILAEDGPITLHAEGDIVLGKLRTDSASPLEITTGGALIDAGNGEIDVIAENARLVIDAVGGVAADGELDIRVAVLDLRNAGSGDVSIRHHGDLRILELSNLGAGATTVSTVAGDIEVLRTRGETGGRGITTTTGQLELYAGDGGVVVNRQISTDGGGVRITAEAGDIILGDGIRVAGAGHIQLLAPEGSVLNDSDQVGWLLDGDQFAANIDWAMRNGKAHIDADTGQITVVNLTASQAVTRGLANGQVLRQAEGTYVQTEGRLTINAKLEIGQSVGGFQYSPLAMYVGASELAVSSSERANVSILTTGSSRILNTDGGNTGSRGGTTGVSSLDGEQQISSPIDAGGEDIVLSGNTILLTSSVRSSDASLTIRSIDPTRPILIGGATNGTGLDASTSLTLDLSALGHLEEGFREIVIGSQEGAHQIHIEAEDEHGNSLTVIFKDSLVLNAPAEGGSVAVASNLHAKSITIQGSGNTTRIYDSEIVAEDGDISVSDAILIEGEVTLRASGSMAFMPSQTTAIGGTINANPDSVVDNKLFLDAGNSIHFHRSIGTTLALDHLEIISAVNVTFDGPVVVDGDLIINATGDVAFNGGLTLNNGGSLIINGAERVDFSGGQIELFGEQGGEGGHVLIEANIITLPEGSDSVVAYADGSTLTLRPTDLARTIRIASPPGSTSGTLNLSNSQLLRIDSGSFARIVIGHELNGHTSADAQNQILIGAANTADAYTFETNVEIYGRTITVLDLSNPDFVFAVNGELVLDALGDISIQNAVEAESIILYSEDGRVRQQNPASGGDGISNEPLRAEQLSVRAANGVDLAWTEINQLTVENLGAGSIRVHVLAARSSGYSSAATIDGHLDVLGAHQRDLEGGNITLSTAAGQLGVVGAGTGVTTASGGNVVLTANGANSDLVIGATVQASSGEMRLTAQRGLLLQGLLQMTEPGSMLLRAVTGDIVQQADILAVGGLVSMTAGASLTMHQDTRIRSVGDVSAPGELDLQAGQGMTLALLESGGDIFLQADGGSIRGIEGVALHIDAAGKLDMTATAGIGSATQALVVQVPSLAALNTDDGGIFLHAQGDLDIVETGLRTQGSEGVIVLTVSGGDLHVDDRIHAVGMGGHILLNVDAGDLIIDGLVRSDRGSVSMAAAGAMHFGADARVQLLGVDAPGQSLELVAGTDILMTAGALLNTNNANNGNQRLQAGGDIRLGRITAGQGQVDLLAEGSISRNLVAGTNNIVAGDLRLEAGGDIGGAGTDHMLRTTVARLAAVSEQGSIYLREGNGLRVDTLAAVNVVRVSDSGSATALADGRAALVGLTSGEDGNIVLRNGAVSGGQLVIDAAMTAAGSGNVRIEAVAGALTVAATVDAGDGHLTLSSSGAMSVQAELRSSQGNLDLGAGGALTVTSAGSLQSDGGDMRLVAAGTLTTGSIDARTEADRLGDLLDSQADWGRVALVSTTGAIVGNSAETHVHASELVLNAAQSVGTGSQHLSVEVLALGGQAGDGLFVTDQSALRVAPIADFQIARVAATGAVSSVDVNGAAGIAAGQTMVLIADQALTVADGAPLHAGGNVRLEAGADLTLAAALNVTAGHASLVAGGELEQRAAIQIDGTGKAVALVAAGDILMATGATTQTEAGAVLYSADGDVVLTELTSASGDNLGAVRVEAGGTVSGSAPGDAVNVTAGALQLAAGASIGETSSPLRVDVDSLAVTAAGDVFIDASGDLTVGTLEAEIALVAGDGSVTTMSPQLAGISITSAGSLVLAVQDVLTVAADLDVEGDAAVWAGSDLFVTASARVGGDLQLQAAADLQVEGTLDAGDDLTVTADKTLTVADAVLGNEIVFTSGEAMTVTGSVTARDGLSWTAGEDLVFTGSLAVTGDAVLDAAWNLEIMAVAADQHSDLTVTGDLLLEAGDAMTLAADLVTLGDSGQLTLAAEKGALALAGTLDVAGDLAATSGTSLSFDGSFFIKGAAALDAGTDLALDGSITVGGALMLQAAGHLAVDGTLDAGDALTASAGKTLTVADTVLGDEVVFSSGEAMTVTGSVTARDGLSWTAGEDLVFAGSLDVIGDALLDAAWNLEIMEVAADQHSDLTVTGDLLLEAGDGMTLAADIVTLGDSGQLTLVAETSALALAGTLDVAGDLAATSGTSLWFDGSFVIKGAAALDAGTDLALDGSITVGGVLILQAADHLAVDGTLAAGDALTASAGKTLTVADTVLGDEILFTSGDAMTVEASVTARAGLTWTSGAALMFTGEAEVTDATTLAADGDLDLAGTLTAGGEILLEAGGAIGVNGMLTGSTAVTLSADADLDLIGSLTAESDLLLEAIGAIEVDGSLEAGGDLALDAGTSLDLIGSVTATGIILLEAAGWIDVDGLLAAGGDLTAHAGGALMIEDTLLGDQLLFIAGTTMSVTGSVTAREGLNWTAGEALLFSGDIAASEAVSLVSGSDLDLSGSLTAGG